MADTTTIRLPPRLRARIHALAKQSGRSAHSFILEAVERHADYEEQMRSLVKEALAADEEIEPSFRHHPGATLPELDRDGVRLRVMAGSAWGATSPVEVRSPLFYVDVAMPAGSELPLPDEHAERAVYVVEGALGAAGASAGSGRMLVFAEGADVTLKAEMAMRAVRRGGAPLDGPRHIDWNFVGSSRERIEKAKADWREGRFPKVPGDETEFVPLPG